MRAELTLSQVTIGIVTALPKERAAVLAVFPTSVRVSGAFNTVYDLFSVAGVGGDNVVALTQLPGMGNNLAAAETIIMIRDCESLHEIIMVGIAGAIPCPEDSSKHVRLGDIVVSGSQGIFQFDLGKIVAGGDFEYRSIPIRPSSQLLGAVQHLQSLEELGQLPWLSYVVVTT